MAKIKYLTPKDIKLVKVHIAANEGRLSQDISDEEACERVREHPDSQEFVAWLHEIPEENINRY